MRLTAMRALRVLAVLDLLGALALTHGHVRTSQFLLLVALCAAPLVVLASSLRLVGDRAPTLAALAAGVLLVGHGLHETVTTKALSLLEFDFTPEQIAVAAALFLAPLGLVALGSGLLLVGAGGFVRGRLLPRLATAGITLLSVCFAGALAASAYGGHAYRGYVGPDHTAFRQAALLLASTVLFLATRVPSVRVPSVRGRADLGENARRAGREVPALGRERVVRWGGVAAVLVVLLGAGGYAYRLAGHKQAPTALFADPALAACIAKGRGTLSRRDLNSVIDLNCTGGLATPGSTTPALGPIRSLQGLDALPHLAALNLAQNQVVDLTPLAKITSLMSLKLSNDQVTDLTPLAGLTKLTNLGLSGNRITDVTPLAHLSGLRTLGLAQNQVSDVGPLRGLTNVTELDLSDNTVSDVEPLAGLTALDRLTLTGNRITDARPLQNLTSLTMLNIARNRLSSAAQVSELPAVDELWIGGNRFTDVSPLKTMPKLRGVDLEGTDPTKVTGVEQLEQKGIYVGGLA